MLVSDTHRLEVEKRIASVCELYFDVAVFYPEQRNPTQGFKALAENCQYVHRNTHICMGVRKCPCDSVSSVSVCPCGRI